MISAYLAEDEPLARAALAAMLRTTDDFAVVGESDNGEQALRDCLRCRPDVLFADIKMPMLDGLELAAALAEHGSPTHVVFITAYDQHAVQAFRLAAIDYLLKPVGTADFHGCLNRLRRACQHEGSRAAGGQPRFREHFIVKSVGRIEVVQIREVIALRATGNYLELLTAQGCHLHRQTLKSVLEQLDPAQFVQVHRSVVVALKHVRRLEQRDGAMLVCLDGELRFPVSSAFRAHLKSSLPG